METLSEIASRIARIVGDEADAVHVFLRGCRTRGVFGEEGRSQRGKTLRYPEADAAKMMLAVAAHRAGFDGEELRALLRLADNNDAAPTPVNPADPKSPLRDYRQDFGRVVDGVKRNERWVLEYRRPLWGLTHLGGCKHVESGSLDVLKPGNPLIEGLGFIAVSVFDLNAIIGPLLKGDSE